MSKSEPLIAAGEYFNIAEGVCDRWAASEAARIALIQKNADGSVSRVSYGELQARANKLANALVERGVGCGARIGIMLPQCVEAAVAHIAIYKIGAIAVPLFGLFGPDAIKYRAFDCEMAAILTDRNGIAKVEVVWNDLPALRFCMVTNLAEAVDDGRVLSMAAVCEKKSDQFTSLKTKADDPALIIYTSGTTGHPKGALHAHRVLLGHLPGLRVSHNNFPQEGDIMWTPADWAWIGGLLDVLLPSLYLGVPVVAHRADKFEAEKVFSLIEELNIRNIFFPPTALKLLRQAEHSGESGRMKVRSIASGGESLGKELLDWGVRCFGVLINEFYGQTECNLVLSSSSSEGIHRPGAIGKAVPGFTVSVVSNLGQELGAGEAGHIAIQTPNPNQMLRYWNNPQATSEKYIGSWLITGDQGYVDDDGYVHFLGRDDDVITSAGYRIGPTPIEDCLLRHPAVELAAVIGKKHPVRTEIVKAYIVLSKDYSPCEALVEDLKQHVRQHLSAHEYPREIEFLESMPLTATGKIVRRELRARAN
ncbi:AMP-binding protein [Pseudomonas sp. BGr12]|uniref:AMP-binding protein n=1 Tax=Pseudomonas sp. BGr12 TaxID=2936269 RepID=UPI002559BF49|nr:AMP-binding protein [Pseudomonas sp. BJa5]MDL2428472.1 AMP-binding protein [Pseudomonas sp. BJa5]